jgi:hypothetical protein
VRELENEIEMLKQQVSNGGESLANATPMASLAANADLRNIKKQLSQDEQMQLQRELA